MQKRKLWVTLCGGMFYALFAAMGYAIEKSGTCGLPGSLKTAALLVLPASLVLFLLFKMSEFYAQRGDDGGTFSAGKAFGFIFLCYVPMLLITFPGSFAYDVPFQLRQVFTGQYSTHHPLLHTLLLGGCVKFGVRIGNTTLGAALYSVIQMALLALCFSQTAASIARSAGARAARRSALFFALYPLHMCFAVNATKDVLFSGLFALMLALAFEVVLNPKPRAGALVGLVLCGGLSMLLRNNALYAVAAWLIVLVFALRRGGIRVCACVLLSVLLAVGGGRLLQNELHAESGDLCEMLSVPIQQLARARKLHGDRLNAAEKAKIDELMPGGACTLYDPTISDPVKFEFDMPALLDDPGAAASVYLSVMKKCPEDYADALLALTHAFWYPYSEYRVSGYYLQMGVGQEFYDWCDFERIESRSLFPSVLASLSWRLGAKGAMQIPFVGYLFNMGAIVWVMLFFVLREAYLGRWKRFAVALLPVLLWGTFLLGPVMAGRYAYAFVCVLPVLAVNHRKTA